MIGTLTPVGQKGKFLGALLTANYVGQFLAPIWSQSILQDHNNNDLFIFSSILAACLMLIVFFATVFTLERGRPES